ncbi:MAG TPA: sigma factor-like helix-turn-helix DNA-binding protein, partial [Candidatus Saccharimonadales bacterium]|nr:sigma factor-like helix-turn-helix DNA-binding protein [Candidatus Saccharimonadales bacterium]
YDRVPDAAIAEDLDISPETVMDLRNLYLTHDAASLEEQLERPTGTHHPLEVDDEVLTLADIIADPDESTEKQVEEDALSDVIHDVLNSLDERSAGIIRLRWGLTGEAPATLDEIRVVYGVSRERIRQIESKAMSVLRHPQLSDRLRTFLEDDDDWESVQKRLAMEKISAEQEEIMQRAKQRREEMARKTAQRYAESSQQTISNPAEIMARYVSDPKAFVRQYTAAISAGKTMPGIPAPAATNVKPKPEVIIEATPYDTFRDIFLQQADNFRQGQVLISAEHIQRAAQRIIAGLPDKNRAEMVARFWYRDLGKLIEASGGIEEFDDSRFNMVFGALLNEVMDESTSLELRVPAEFDGQFDRFASGLQAGRVIVLGNLGNRAGENMSGTAQLIVYGNVDNLVGANAHDQAQIIIHGSAGSNAGFAMRGTSRLTIHGKAGWRLGREAARTATIVCHKNKHAAEAMPAEILLAQTEFYEHVLQQNFKKAWGSRLWGNLRDLQNTDDHQNNRPYQGHGMINLQVLESIFRQYQPERGQAPYGIGRAGWDVVASLINERLRPAEPLLSWDELQARRKAD